MFLYFKNILIDDGEKCVWFITMREQEPYFLEGRLQYVFQLYFSLWQNNNNIGLHVHQELLIQQFALFVTLKKLITFLFVLSLLWSTAKETVWYKQLFIDCGMLFAGEVNGGFMGDAHSVAGSRKSLNLHPVLLMPQPGDADRYIIITT